MIGKLWAGVVATSRICFGKTRHQNGALKTLFTEKVNTEVRCAGRIQVEGTGEGLFKKVGWPLCRFIAKCEKSSPRLRMSRNFGPVQEFGHDLGRPRDRTVIEEVGERSEELCIRKAGCLLSGEHQAPRFGAAVAPSPQEPLQDSGLQPPPPPAMASSLWMGGNT